MNIQKWHDTLSRIKWDFIFYKYYLFNTKFRDGINRNKLLKDKHLGERCFIIGNGPSLKKMNLSILKDEYVFTVNNLMRNDDIYKNIYSDFHVLIDPAYYKLNENKIGDKETLSYLKKINTYNKRIKCFMKIEGMFQVERYNLDGLDIFYMFMHNNLGSFFTNKISLVKNVPGAQNVIHAALYAAIYMGFKKIYLLGCDMTSLFLTFEATEEGEKKVREMHAYTYSEIEKKRISEISHDNEYMLYDYAKTFSIFKQIKKYALTNGIEIYNATPGGGLDVFDRIRFDSLFFQ